MVGKIYRLAFNAISQHSLTPLLVDTKMRPRPGSTANVGGLLAYFSFSPPNADTASLLKEAVPSLPRRLSAPTWPVCEGTCS